MKLSDVGMSRVLESSDYYKKTTSGKVPAIWMPPESLFNRVYTTKSDVWSYGVLCWEVYSLGARPYDGKTAEEVAVAVLHGYRLSCPALCPVEVFKVVTECWDAEPDKRPAFRAIVLRIQDLTEEESVL